MHEAVFDEAINHARDPLRIGDGVEVRICLWANGLACFMSMCAKELENASAIDTVWMRLFGMARFLGFLNAALWNGNSSCEKLS